MMNHQKGANLIDELTPIAQIIPMVVDDGQPRLSFGFGEKNISFVGIDDANKYLEFVEQLFSTNQELTETFSLETFERRIINLIRALKKGNKKCTTDDFGKIIGELLEVEVQEYEIFYDFYGATLRSPTMQFGDFTVYDINKSIDIVFSKYPDLRTDGNIFLHPNSELLIAIKVNAREDAKAVEIADKLCESFENVFGYAIADLTHRHRIGILNFRGWKRINRTVCSRGSTGYSGNTDIPLRVDLDNPIFKDKNIGNNKIWHLITKKNKNEIEKRLLNAIEWIGKAVYDRDTSKSIVQFVFAIEGMLQSNEKEFITPSIISHLSDWLAFIIADNKEQRKTISKYFKDLYQKRSAIAHGAAKIIDIEDLRLAKDIAKTTVVTFLTKSPYKEMATMEQLNAFVTDLKFT